MSRRFIDPQSAADIGKLDPEAIARVRAEAWPDAATPDELHDALSWLTFITAEEAAREHSWSALLQELMKQRRASRLSHASANVIVSAERLPLFEAVFPDATYTPPLTTPAAHAKAWTREDALREIVRGRLEGLGPTTATGLAASLGVRVTDVDAALIALEAEGSAMRGQFESAPTPTLPRIAWEGEEGAAVPAPTLAHIAGEGGSDQSLAVQWCSRRLLARIHRYTVKRLRAEIEPVQARDFLRFLFDWQRVTPSARMQGPDSVAAVLAQLEGFDAPASSWETELLPMRIAEYEPAWLDEQCLAGRIVWTRLAPRASDGERGAAPVRSTPIALLARKNVRWWSTLTPEAERAQLTPKAQQVADFIRQHGASFFDEIGDGAGLLPSQVEEALAELVALGLVNSDSFGGLRALLLPSDRKRPTARDARRKRRIAIFGMQDAGRWALVRRASPDASQTQGARGAEAIEHLCRTLLRRWGVVFWKLVQREADWLPPWRELLLCLRRLEARGEIRGGRFVAGFSGEQYALPEAVGALRDARRKPESGELISLSAADPLNLIGVITPGARLPSITSNRVLYRDGLPLAMLVGGEVRFLEAIEDKDQWPVRTALLRRHVPAPLADLA
jgi:ATP-dependent Lhr-like helicase